MTPPTACARIARAVNLSALIGTGSGQLRQAHYPHQGIPTAYPCLQLFWDETSIEHAMDLQTWLIRVRGQLLTALMGEPMREVPKVDGVIVGLADLFAPELHPSNAILEVAGEPGTADHCFVAAVQPSAGIAYGSIDPNHYGAEIFWECKLSRIAGTT